MADLTIGELEDQSGVPRRTIYFYVQQGILPPPRGAGLGARYEREHLDRLRAIPELRARGWRLDRIREYFRRAASELIPLAAGRSAEAGQSISLDASLPLRVPTPAPLRPETLTRYHLAPGVDLHVEPGALPRDRARIRRLLDAAAAIFGECDEPIDGSPSPVSSEPASPSDG